LALLRQQALSRLENALSFQYWFRRFPYGWLNREPLKSAEVVNLHNLHGGYFNYLALPWLTTEKPTCWSLHDMWSLTGHCAYSYDCDRWKTGCYRCPLLHSRGEERRLLAPEATLVDVSRLVWHLKKNLYRRSRLTIVVGSTWMREQVSQSILGDCARVVHIPDGTDLAVFRPIERAAARQSLDIPQDVRVVLIYATPANARKGLNFALEALELLQPRHSSWVISVGERDVLGQLPGRFPIRQLGFLQSDTLRNVAYCAADVFLQPTLADNLPLTVLDSLASGTPVVAFRVGGVPDAVRHLQTGYLAAYKNAEDLAKGLGVILNDSDLRSRMSQRCRQVAEQEFSLETQAARYAELYQDLLAGS
jgi:glycosyltransferase involved in cell wall biosynthesis